MVDEVPPLATASLRQREDTLRALGMNPSWAST